MYVGLPQWRNNAWAGIGLRSLTDYAKYFNCVEGNTTFYALPKQEAVMRWRDMTPESFRFCFKFPSDISHKAALANCQRSVDLFYRMLEPLGERVGQLWLQLPAKFAPVHLDRLWQFLDTLPNGFDCGVEVRHPDFFNKGEEERALNQGLHRRGINRTILDSRPIHSSKSTAKAVLEAKRRKPALPLHVLATSSRPIVRFIGGDSLDANRLLFGQWIRKLEDWQSKGFSPYLFIHTPDCTDVPQQARSLWQDLHQKIPSVQPAPDWPEQGALLF